MTIIEYNGLKYEFTWKGVILFLILAPSIAYFSYWLVDVFWLYTHRPVIEQTVLVINLLHITDPPITWGLSNHYYYYIPSRGGYIGFETMCTGMQANAIFLGLILATPHPLDKEARRRIWLRKGIAIAVSWTIFYIVNILRMVIQIGLYANGANWEDIHTSISAASSFIAALIVILVHRWLPEFILMIIWIMGEIRKFVTSRRKITAVSEPNRPEDTVQKN